MPGMMDTVLNLGLNSKTVKALEKKSKNKRFALDSYRRFIQMFSNVVMNLNIKEFEEILDNVKETKQVRFDVELDELDLELIITKYKELYFKKTKKEFPEDIDEQLWLAIEAVFKSWNNERAIAYRKINKIENAIGTAVNIQAMVFGNLGDSSGTGVCFTRDPNTGKNELYGEFLINAQGEDVVAGIRTPHPIKVLKEHFPEQYSDLIEIKKKLEEHFKDMQDLEFTIEEGKLFLLQTRNGKRNAEAAVKIAVDLVHDKLITKKQGLMMVSTDQIDQLMHPQISPLSKNDVLAKGLPASPGAACGSVVFNAEDAEKENQEGKLVILVRPETSPEDIKGMHSSQGILTSTGGMTSHAAVVARGMGKCSIVGCSEIKIDEKNQLFKTENGVIVKKGDIISLNGTSGEVLLGQAKLEDAKLSENFKRVLSWADEVRRLGIKTNADNKKDASIAKEFKCEGIGLCRTEHMFFEGERITHIRKLIISSSVEERRVALKKLLPYQRDDFIDLFKEMNGLPVTIRLLDPPLHEFLPKTQEDLEEMAKEFKMDISDIKEKSEALHEFNPMLGHRGCRLAITYPEIYGMQVQAIFEAAFKCYEEDIDVKPQIMIPLIGDVKELKEIKNYLEGIINRMIKDYQIDINYKVGTMIEVPRAALTSDEIAQNAEFFSFGTNDLTQMTLGFSRDDSGRFIKEYLKKGILKNDPFKTIDEVGVGRLVRLSSKEGKKANHDLEIGICGEHGGDPESIEFLNSVLEIDYVSCSPFRVPIARLAAAQAEIRRLQKQKE
jgi:pyruvate,orthophosphate dikinase